MEGFLHRLGFRVNKTHIVLGYITSLPDAQLIDFGLYFFLIKYGH